MWSLNLADARVLSWVCFLALWMTLAVTYLEFGRNVVLIGGLIAILLVTIVLQRFGLHALPESFHFLEKIPAPFTAYLWLMTGIFMALLWIPEYFGAWWYYKWEFTPAVIRHIMPGGDTIEYRLEQVIVTFTTGDWFERLVCGTGTIILKDRVNHKVLAMIENVWDLKKKEAILQKLLPRESL
ncbi:MAG: hypothetical protein Q7R81_05475 [Candidatus Peregrinibacteria bacterium]|nr:hypothetical protein [Candidatus Peregrinibacteria bacterium]